METAKSCIILVDGSNFYYKLKDLSLHKLITFNFSAFAKYIARSYKILSSTYYVGGVRQDGTEKGNQLLANQQKVLAGLRKHKWRYHLGYIMKNGTEYHEKGVDVKIATDILICAYENLADQIIVVSSDTDLEPAIAKAKELGKEIEYVGFSHKPSMAMIRFATETTLLKKDDLLPFLAENSQIVS